MTEVYVKVRPGSDQFKVEMAHIPRIYLESEAEQGKANSELIAQLTEITGEKPAIISGHRSRRKKIKISMPEEEFRQKLEEVQK